MYGVRQRDSDSYFSSMVVEYGPSVSAQLKEQVPLQISTATGLTRCHFCTGTRLQAFAKERELNAVAVPPASQLAARLVPSLAADASEVAVDIPSLRAEANADAGLAPAPAADYDTDSFSQC